MEAGDLVIVVESLPDWYWLTYTTGHIGIIRKTRVNVNTSIDLKTYTDVEKIRVELENSKKIFKKNNWPSIDVTRRSVEETAASIIKIYEIKKNK